MAIFGLAMYYQVAQYEGKGGFMVFSDGVGQYHPESDRATYSGGGILVAVPQAGQQLEPYPSWLERETNAVYDEGQANMKEHNRLLQEGVSKVEEMVDPSAPTDEKARADYLKLRKEMLDLEASETTAQHAARCAPQREESPLDALHRHQEEWAAAASAKSDAANKAEVDREAGAAAHIAQLERELGLKK